MAAPVSFRRGEDAHGWRYTLGYRTKRFGRAWEVERWNGEGWVGIGAAGSYAQARDVATRDRAERSV